MSKALSAMAEISGCILNKTKHQVSLSMQKTENNELKPTSAQSDTKYLNNKMLFLVLHGGSQLWRKNTYPVSRVSVYICTHVLWVIVRNRLVFVIFNQKLGRIQISEGENSEKIKLFQIILKTFEMFKFYEFLDKLKHSEITSINT